MKRLTTARSVWSGSVLGATFLWSQLEWAVHPNPPLRTMCFVWCVGSATLGTCVLGPVLDAVV